MIWKGINVYLRSFAVLMMLLASGLTKASSSGFVNEDYELVKVADGVYAFIAPESDSGVVQGNSTVVIGEDSVLVVDTGQFPSLAERMVSDIKKITNKPVRYVVNTHWHMDHYWGNSVFRDAYPGVVFISTEFTRELIEDQSPKYLISDPINNRKMIESYRKILAEGKMPDGRVLTEDMRKSLTRTAETLVHLEPEYPKTIHVAPSVAFDKQLTIELGHRLVKVMWLGKANTAGDAVTWVPDAKVMITGDVVVFPIPFAFGSHMTQWPEVLQKMIDMGPTAYVPGHGPVMRDSEYLETLIQMFRSLTSQVKAAVDKNLNLEETRKTIDLEQYKKKLAGNNYRRNSSFRGAFLAPAIDRAFQEATGHLKPETDD